MERELRVFSPSATETFARCPRKWALKRLGWVPRIISYPELCAVLGDGFSESMRVFNTSLITGNSTISVEEVVEAGNKTMQDRLDADFAAGRRIDEKDIPFYDILQAKLEQAVKLYIEQNPLKAWRIIQAEKTYDDYGSARIDVLAKDSFGPAVFDYKIKVKLDKEWEDAEFERHRRSQQRFHYQWATGADRFFIILVVLGGNKKAAKPRVVLSPPYGGLEYFKTGLWLSDSKAWWQVMDSVLESGIADDLYAIPGSPTHADQFGACEYEQACLTHALDPKAMAIEYVKVERRKWPTQPTETLK